MNLDSFCCNFSEAINFKGNVAASQTSGFVIREWSCKLLVDQILFISEVRSLLVCYLCKINSQFSVVTEL